MVFTRSDIIAFFSFLLSGISVAVSLVASVRAGRAERVNTATVFHSLLYIDPVSQQLAYTEEELELRERERYGKVSVEHVIAYTQAPYTHVDTYLAVKTKNLDSTRALAGLKASIFVKNVERGWRIWKKPWFRYYSADLPDMQPLQTVDTAATTFNAQSYGTHIERFLARVLPATYADAPNAADPHAETPYATRHLPSVKLRLVVTRTTADKPVKMDRHDYWLKPQFEYPITSDRDAEGQVNVSTPARILSPANRLIRWRLESATAREKNTFAFWPF